MKLINLIEFNSLGDKRGELISLEQMNNIPFEIKRVYYLLKTKQGVSRGFHAHKVLRQVAICITGSCRIVMNDGKEKQDVLLNSPNQGLIIEPMQWHEMYDFSENCILMVVADNHYLESDYIRDYKDFKKRVNDEF